MFIEDLTLDGFRGISCTVEFVAQFNIVRVSTQSELSILLQAFEFLFDRHMNELKRADRTEGYVVAKIKNNQDRGRNLAGVSEIFIILRVLHFPGNGT